jgi:hypothetical protein
MDLFMKPWWMVSTCPTKHGSVVYTEDSHKALSCLDELKGIDAIGGINISK